MPQLITVKINNVDLQGILDIPESAAGIVVFAHGSGSSRLSPRNSFVAKSLSAAQLGTLLIDLLDPEEDSVYQTRFNIDFLAERLTAIVSWVQQYPLTQYLPIGLFGASTGAAAALKVAAKADTAINAVVSRGGRPDLAMEVLAKVHCPTLLIAGGNDFEVLQLNQAAYQALTCTKRLEVIPDATHLFEEPEALGLVADLAKSWFKQYLKENLR